MPVQRLDITTREPYAGGQAFGDVGPYEMIEGRLHFAVAPTTSNNGVIADLALAPRNAAGEVEFSSDFQLLRPMRQESGGRLLYDVLNRGNKTVGRLNFSTVGQGTVPAPGDGFLMRQGFTLAWCGWQPDAPAQPGAMRAYLPEAIENGARITGQASLQFQPVVLVHEQMLSDAGHQPLPTADTNDASAVLTVRDYQDGPASAVPRADWCFGRVKEAGKIVNDDSFIASTSGFQPGKVYELVYTTVGAPVMGLGLVATRDCVSWLRYGNDAETNPVAGELDFAYGFGVSMSGRYLREFVYLGLNEDESKRRIFDGLLVLVGSSRRGEFNFRFAQPSTNISRAPGNLPPFTYDPLVPTQASSSDSILGRARAQGNVPNILAINSGMEYWWSGASLLHTDASGIRDIPFPAEVRTYFACGTQHAPGGLPLSDRMAGGFRAAHLLNTVDSNLIARAALVNLDDWVREAKPPPPSHVPSFSAGTAVTRESVASQIRAIPGAHFPNHLPRRSRLDFGLAVSSGLVHYPPTQGEDYPVAVSALDADGNEIGGVRPVDLRVPLATYAGWNVRHGDSGQPGEYVSGPLPGSTIPFAKTRQEREAMSDPRPSIEERYAGREDYLVRVRDAAQAMVSEGHLLAEDIAVAQQQAAERWDAFLSR